MNEAEAGIAGLLLRLESELLDPTVRRDRDRLLSLLSEDFTEFGASGRAWTRDEIVEFLSAEDFDPPEIEDFRCRIVAPGVALVTYRTASLDAGAGLARIANRSSIWRQEMGQWKIVFHQGTPAGAPATRPS